MENFELHLFSYSLTVTDGEAELEVKFSFLRACTDIHGLLAGDGPGVSTSEEVSSSGLYSLASCSPRDVPNLSSSLLSFPYFCK